MKVFWHARGLFDIAFLAVFTALLCGSCVSFNAFEGAHQLGKL